MSTVTTSTGSPKRGVMVTNLNDVFVSSASSAGDHKREQGQVSEAVIKKCSKVEPTTDEEEHPALDDSAVVSMLVDMEASMEQEQRRSKVGAKKSMLPKPEISPKPTHLKPVHGSSDLMSGSSHFPAAGGPAFNMDEAERPSSSCSKPSPSTKTLAEKTKGTASMLKSTLKRMTRLSIKVATSSANEPAPASTTTNSSSSSRRRSVSPFRSSSKRDGSSPPSQQQPDASSKVDLKPSGTNSSRTRAVGGGGGGGRASSLNRERLLQPRRSNEAFKVPDNPPPPRSLCRSTSNSLHSMPNRSHSLKRPGRNKDAAAAAALSNPLQRSGSGVITTTAGVKRSNSMHHHSATRKFRDRDLNVRLSRGTQTLLTRDVLNDEDDDDDQANVVEFVQYMPDVLGSETGNDVETHVSEPTEPVDVRRNRQLTLDNMKLHREVEKLRWAASESDQLKRELRSVRSRLEEEKRLRARIERELDQHNEKVELIERSMDGVEREFEVKDAAIAELEAQLREARTQIGTLWGKLKVANDVVGSQSVDLSEAVAAQKSAVEEYERAEMEANELHEFLQAEKATLAEALKETEAEARNWKEKVGSSEERCGHLVRLGEQRHQEILALDTQLKAMEDKAKEMLLAQGAEISRSSVLIDELRGKLEDAFKTAFPTALNGRQEAKSAPGRTLSIDDLIHDLEQERDDDAAAASTTVGGGEYLLNGDDGSLQNLSNAIHRRLNVESHARQCRPSDCVPTLVDRIGEVDTLVDKLVVAIQPSEAVGPSGRVAEEDQKENISLNGKGTSEKEGLTKRYEEEIAEMKAKYLKHRQILISNREQAEGEVMRLDDIYHDTVDDVLNTLAAVPDVVRSNSLLSRLQNRLQNALPLNQEETEREANDRLTNRDTVTMNQLNTSKATK